MPINLSNYSDLPTTQDELGYDCSASALFSIINEVPLEDTPLTIGVFGPWGSGKTSLMLMLQERLNDVGPEASSIPIWFDAWRYGREDSLWRAFLLAIVEGLRTTFAGKPEWLREVLEIAQQMKNGQAAGEIDDKTLEAERRKLNQDLDDLVASLYRCVEREELGGVQIDWHKAGSATIRAAIHLGFSMVPVLGPALGIAAKAIEKAQEKVGEGDDVASLYEIFQRERSKIYREQVRSVEQFYLQLRKLISERVVGANKRLIVFVDDLDRCLPEQAIGVLEAVKVLLDIPGCIFVLGFDREVIEQGIRVRYKEFALSATTSNISAPFPIAGRDYLEKVVQVPFEIPPLSADSIRRFLAPRLGRDGLNPTETEAVLAIMTSGVIPNPRRLKRTLNTYRLLRMLAKTQARSVDAGILAKFDVLQNSYPDIYNYISGSLEALVALEHLSQRPIHLVDTHGKVDEDWYTVAPMFPHMAGMLQGLESPLAELISRVHSGSTTDDQKLKSFEQAEARRLLTCIPDRLIMMLKLPPRIEEVAAEELVYYIFLTRVTRTDTADPGQGKSTQ